MARAFAIVGAGGFGREMVTYAQDAHDDGWGYEAVGFVDDSRSLGEEVLPGLPVIGTTREPPKGVELLIALGDAGVRRTVARLAADAGNRLVTFVHPTAYIARNAIVGSGSLICPFALVGAGATVGENVAINIYAAVGHDARVDAHGVLSPYSSLMGAASLGTCGFLGAYASVAPTVAIGSHSKVAAGAFAYSDAPPGSLLAGNPARGKVMFKVVDE